MKNINRTIVNEMKELIERKIQEEGFKDDQIEIDFAGLAGEEEIKRATKELKYDVEQGEGQGVYWIYK